MHKGRALRQKAVKGAGNREQAYIEQADKSRRGPKRDLQKHLQQLFHPYCQEESEEEEEE